VSDTTTATVPSYVVIMLANQIPMRTDRPRSTAELQKVTAEIAEAEARLHDLRLSEVLLRLDLLPKGLYDRFMDLARAVHFDTLEGADRYVPVGELARRLGES
jgi:hypothetical protein